MRILRLQGATANVRRGGRLSSAMILRMTCTQTAKPPIPLHPLSSLSALSQGPDPEDPEARISLIMLKGHWHYRS